MSLICVNVNEKKYDFNNILNKVYQINRTILHCLAARMQSLVSLSEDSVLINSLKEKPLKTSK